MIDIENPDYADTPVSTKRSYYNYKPEVTQPVPVVSIITPFYNTDESFLETASSILNQSFQDWEWVIVDDGSTNLGALERLSAVAASDLRIRTFVQENAGPSAARNHGFRQSSGRFICLLDSDDLLEPTFIEKCIWFLESEEAFGFCGSWSVSFGNEEFLWRAGFERGIGYLESNSGPLMAVIRREAYESIGGFDESIRLGHEDWDFWLALARAGYWGYTLPEFLAWYRKSKGGRFSQVLGADNVHREFEAKMARKYADLEGQFPAPRRRDPIPYETVSPVSTIANPLDSQEGDKRILYLIPWMVTGGADRVNLEWISLLRDNGFQVSVCATLNTHHNWMSQFAQLTPDIFVLPNFLRVADYSRFILYLIRSRKINTVLISASTFGYQILPFLKAHCPHVVFIDLCHVEEAHWLNGGHPRFSLGYQDLLDLNLVTTGALRHFMISRGGDPDRIKVCYSGVGKPAMPTGDAPTKTGFTEFGLVTDKPVIVFAGRICAQKRPALLAAIFRELVSRDVQFQALVIGDGDLRPMLRKRISDFGLTSSVQFLGSVDHDRWLEILSIADIFLLPSEYEGISVALLESMAMQVVPVVSDVGGHSEVLTPSNGFLIPLGDTELEGYVSALTQLLDQPELRQRMGYAASDCVEKRFSLSATTNRLIELLDLAKHLSINAPRQIPTIGFAIEMATLATEYSRLNHVADVLWSQRTHPGMQPSPSLSVSGAVRLLRLIAETRVGIALLESAKFRQFGRWLLARLEANSAQRASRRRL